MPKKIGSQEMPTTAPPPPPAGLKKVRFQCSSSPVRRSAVTARVMSAGIRTRSRIEGRDVSDMRLLRDDRRAVESRSIAPAGPLAHAPPARGEGHEAAPVGQRRGGEHEVVPVERDRPRLLDAFPVREEA